MPCRTPSPTAVTATPTRRPLAMVIAAITRPASSNEARLGSNSESLGGDRPRRRSRARFLPLHFGDLSALDLELQVACDVAPHSNAITPGQQRPEECCPDDPSAEMAFPNCGMGSVPVAFDPADLDLESRERLRYAEDRRADVATDVGHHARGAARPDRGLDHVFVAHRS